MVICCHLKQLCRPITCIGSEISYICLMIVPLLIQLFISFVILINTLTLLELLLMFHESQIFYFPCMSKIVRQFCKKCHVCERTNKSKTWLPCMKVIVHCLFLRVLGNMSLWILLSTFLKWMGMMPLFPLLMFFQSNHILFRVQKLWRKKYTVYMGNLVLLFVIGIQSSHLPFAIFIQTVTN